MVKTPSKPGISPETLQERAETINWLKTLRLPPLPVAPAQDPHKYPKRNKKGEIEYEKDGVTPKSLFTGKNPSYLDECGTPHLVNHKEFQKRLSTDKQLELWFANPLNGIGTLGGWHDTIWLDFDVKQFATSSECESVALEVASHVQTQAGAEPFLERSHSGGWRIGIRVKQKPDFTNFALAPGAKHVGEALGEGRFTVLAPTIGPSGNPYESINRVAPPEVETLGSIGIYPTSTRSKTSVAPSTPTLRGDVVPGSIPLEMLGHDASREILNGANPTGDRSEALTLAIREWYGWTNWTSENGIRVSGDATTLAHYAGSNLGIDSDRVDRILKTIDPTQCHPAALQVGGEESCWKKVRKLDRATFEQQCPAHTKDAIKRELGRNPGSGFANNGAGKSNKSHQASGKSNSESADGVLPQLTPSAIEKPPTNCLSQQIDEILNRNLDDSEQDIALLQLAQDWGRSKREIKEIAEKRLAERELQDTRSERLKDIQRLEQLERIQLDLEDFLHPNLAKPIKHMARVRRLRPEFFLAGLLPIAASLIGTKGFVRISRGSDDYQLPSVINVGLVGEASSGKSPVVSALMRPLKQCLNAVAAGELPATQIGGRTMKAAIRLMQFFLGQLSIIRAQGEASIKRETGLAAIYREIERLCVRLEGKADILTARMVQSARIPQLEGVKAPKIVELFKDMVAMGRAQLVKVKRSWGLVIRSVLGGGDSHPPNTPNTPDRSDGSSPGEVVEFAEELLENWQEPEPYQNNGSMHSAEVLEMLEKDNSGATAQVELPEKHTSTATAQQSSISANTALDLENTGLEGELEIPAIDPHSQQNASNDLSESSRTQRHPKTTLCDLQATVAACTVVFNYQKGSKVRVISGDPNEVGKTGTIADIDSNYEYPYNVVEENYSFSAWFAAEQLQPIETVLSVNDNGTARRSPPQQVSFPQYRYCGERPATGTVDIKGQKRSACSSADAPNVATASLTLSRLYTIEAGTSVVILDETHSHPETMCYVRPANANNWESGIAVKREDLLAQ